MCQEKKSVRAGLTLCQLRHDRNEEAETVFGIVGSFQRTQSFQAPRLITIDRFECFVLVALSVVYVRLWQAIWLAGVPEVHCLFGPRLCRTSKVRSLRNFAEEDPTGILISLKNQAYSFVCLSQVGVATYSMWFSSRKA